MKKNPLNPLAARFAVFLVGPTAVGKTAVSIELAKRFHGEIISADSMQVYTGMDLGTAKPDLRQRQEVSHHLIDVRLPSEAFSVYEYRQLAIEKIRELLMRQTLPIITGGSGLYVRALLEGLSEQPGAQEALRESLKKQALRSGLPKLYERLRQADPASAQKIKPTDEKRIIRALEILETSGKKPSQWHGRRVSLQDLGITPIVLGMTRDREELYRIIGERVDQMFRSGFVDEVRKLSQTTLSRTAAQAVGYKEILALLKTYGSCCECIGAGLDEVREKIKLHTRHFAKRQWTWFKKEKGIRWFSWQEGDTVGSMCDRLAVVIEEEIRRGAR